MRSAKISRLLDTIDDSIEGQKNVSVSDLVDALEKRGFGALLLMPALVTVLPTGAIPGVPAACAGVICLVAGQLAAGKKRPWLPGPLAKVSISRKKISDAIKRSKPYAEAVDELAQVRYEFLTKDAAQRIIAVLCIVLALMMGIVGFIPFAPVLFSLPVLLFAAGMCLRDGLLTLSGFVLCFVAVAALPLLFTLIK
ncbi:MAG: exopolysaccharide biosynthesis protein [Alphaproteobacteria bacterium]